MIQRICYCTYTCSGTSSMEGTTLLLSHASNGRYFRI